MPNNFQDQKDQNKNLGQTQPGSMKQGDSAQQGSAQGANQKPSSAQGSYNKESDKNSTSGVGNNMRKDEPEAKDGMNSGMTKKTGEKENCSVSDKKGSQDNFPRDDRKSANS